MSYQFEIRNKNNDQLLSLQPRLDSGVISDACRLFGLTAQELEIKIVEVA